MKLPISLLVFFAGQFTMSWSQIHIYEYLVPKENITYTYACYFVNNTDTVKEMVEYEYKSVLMGASQSTENEGATEIEMDTYPTYTYAQLAGKKIYYLENKATQEAYGSNHFLFSAIVPMQGKLALAPYFFPDELSKLTPESFTNTIPEFVDPNDTLKLIDGNRTSLLYGFTLENLEIPTHFNKIPCLKIEIEERWPKNIYHAQVWLSIELGIVKWIRATGRTETLIFHQ